MGVFKILGGIALGVGAVAAAPFTGGGSILGAATLVGSLAGAGTVAAAVGAGVVGGVVGSKLSEIEEDDKNYAYSTGRKEGEATAKAKHIEELQKIKVKFEELKNKANGFEQYEKFLIASYGIGIAVANCDGHIAEEEKKDLEMFVQGISESKLPDTLKNKIKSMYDNPINFNEALELVKKVNSDEWCYFTSIIELIIESDEQIKPEEQQLMSAWQYFLSNN